MITSVQVPRPAWTSRVNLASGSPRRKFLLESAGLQVDVIPQDADESWPSNQTVEEAVQIIARRKLQFVELSDTVTVAADTVVALGSLILGKPENEEAAKETLRRLSGRTHQVSSGVALGRGDRILSFAVTTQVTFRELSEEAIGHYVSYGESLDKAGAYGIQGRGAALVSATSGSYTNVVGLPVAETLEALWSMA